jgi:hypothetical protein
MAWQPNIPAATDQLSVSQGDLQGNFQALNTAVGVDHYLPGVANDGKHKQVTLPVQSPVPTFAAGEVGVYNFLDPVSGVNQLYVTFQDGTNAPISASKGATDGYTYLPSGLLIKWGSASPSGEQTVNYAVGADIPVFTAVYSASVTTQKSSVSNDRFVCLKSFNTTSITLVSTLQTATTATLGSCRYMVIGK